MMVICTFVMHKIKRPQMWLVKARKQLRLQTKVTVNCTGDWKVSGACYHSCSAKDQQISGDVCWPSVKLACSYWLGVLVPYAGANLFKHLGCNRFAKTNQNQFQIFGFYAIDLSNLKPVSRNRRNLLGRWFRLRTVTWLCCYCVFVCGRFEFLFVIHGKHESNTTQKSDVVINKTI